MVYVYSMERQRDNETFGLKDTRRSDRIMNCMYQLRNSMVLTIIVGLLRLVLIVTAIEQTQQQADN
jgi:hypothetical protein